MISRRVRPLDVNFRPRPTNSDRSRGIVDREIQNARIRGSYFRDGFVPFRVSSVLYYTAGTCRAVPDYPALESSVAFFRFGFRDTVSGVTRW